MLFHTRVATSIKTHIIDKVLSNHKFHDSRHLFQRTEKNSFVITQFNLCSSVISTQGRSTSKKTLSREIFLSKRISDPDR